MPTKNKKTKAYKPKVIGKNEITGFRIGSIGDRIGEAYLASKTRDEVVSKAVSIMRVVCEKKKKSTKEEYLHLRAASWVGFLRDQHPNLYKELPSHKAVAA